MLHTPTEGQDLTKMIFGFASRSATARAWAADALALFLLFVICAALWVAGGVS